MIYSIKVLNIIFISSCIIFLNFSFCQSKSFTLDPQWNNTKILFYGDDFFKYGYLMPFGFINIFSKELKSSLFLDRGIIWDDITTISKQNIGKGFIDIRTTLENIKPSILIMHFGFSDILREIPYEDEYDYFSYNLEVMIAVAQELNITTILTSSPLAGDNIYDKNDIHDALEHLSGISGSVAALYKVPFLDVFLNIHNFIDKYNVHRFNHHVVTYDGKILNESGNKIVAAMLLDLFGIKFEGSDHESIYQGNNLLRNTITFEQSLPLVLSGDN